MDFRECRRYNGIQWFLLENSTLLLDPRRLNLVLLMSNFGLADDRTVFGEIDAVLERERAADETVGALFCSRDARFFDGKPIVLACSIENGIPDREVEMRRIEFA